MKNLKKYLAGFIITFYPLFSLSQQSNVLNSFIVKRQSIPNDTVGKTVFRTDSENVNVFLNFPLLKNNIKEIYLMVGPSPNSAYTIKDTIRITNQNNNFNLNWNNTNNNLNFTGSVFITYKVRSDENLVWGTVSVKDNLNQISQKKYCSLK